MVVGGGGGGGGGTCCPNPMFIFCVIDMHSVQCSAVNMHLGMGCSKL